jgi:hypothetical protein
MDHELPSESDSGFVCDEQYNTGTGQTAAGKAATYPHLIRREIHTGDGGGDTAALTISLKLRNPHL